MKASLIRCVNAWEAVQALMAKEWDYQDAYTLTLLNRKLSSRADFFVREEAKLAREYGKIDEGGQLICTAPGEFVLRDSAQAAEYDAKRLKLCCVEENLDWEELTLHQPERIRPVQIEALEGFIRFEDREGDGA